MTEGKNGREKSLPFFKWQKIYEFHKEVIFVPWQIMPIAKALAQC